MAKKITVIQDGIKECGSACLLSLIRYYGGNISLMDLVEMTKTTKDGTNFYNLLEAATEIGLTGKAYKTDDINMLRQIDKPFISQVVINNYMHFIVVYKIKNNKITAMDPAKGMVTLTTDKFIKIWTGYILILEPYKKLPFYEDNNAISGVIKEIIYKNKSIISNILILTLIIIIFTIIYSYHFKIIIDNVINTDKSNLLVITIIFMIVLGFKLITEYLRNNLLLYFNQKIDLSIIDTTINKIISLPYSYYKNRTTGEVISRVNDLFYIKNTIAKIITSLILDIILSIVIFVILYNINIKMTNLLLIITILYFIIFLIFKNIIKNNTKKIQIKNGDANSLLVESISSFDTIKGLNIENIFKKKIMKKYIDLISSNMELTKVVYSSEFLKNFFEGTIIIYIIYVGVSLVMDNELSIGSLITYNTLLYYSLNGIKNMFDFYREFYYAKNSIRRINNLLNFKYEKLDKLTNLDIGGDIEIVNLNFSYNNKNKILDNINLKIPLGSKVLILGTSGSGKSTLLKILYKYYDVDRGSIFLNGYDINDFSLSDIRKRIVYISQNEFLYTDTVRNNIVLDRTIKEDDFLKICNLTYVNQIIKNNILSYDMRLEENGINISGGERQRIIMARAMIKKADIVLIDEGLNEIDINLERKILVNMFRYYLNKTVIIISHRLENIDLFDKVVNLESGKVRRVYVKRELNT